MMSIHRRCTGAILLAAALAAVPLFAQHIPANPETYHGIDPRNIDKTVSPGTDFYRFADGGWLAANPVPATTLCRLGASSSYRCGALQYSFCMPCGVSIAPVVA